MRKKRKKTKEKKLNKLKKLNLLQRTQRNNKPKKDKKAKKVKKAKKKSQKTKRTEKLIVCLLIACLLASIGVLLSYSKRAKAQITNLQVNQVKNKLEISWNDFNCKYYIVKVESSGEDAQIFKTNDSHYTVEEIKYLEDYTISVSGIDKKEEEIPGLSQEIRTKKPRTIKLNVEEIRGFETEQCQIEVTTEGKYNISSDNENITVDKSGYVSLESPGVATITITSKETDEYLETTKEIKAICYPEELPEIKTFAKNITKATTQLRWNKIAYADKYVIERYNENKEEYKTFKTISAGSDTEESSFIKREMARMSGKYRVVAIAKVGDKELRSESNVIEVKSDIKNARTYSKIKIIKTLDEDDLDYLGNVKGKHRSAQSICFTGKSYVAVVVNKGNSNASLTEMSRDGEILRSVDAGNLRHGNGCTYNPDTNTISVLTTSSHGGSKTIQLFSAKTLKNTGSDTLFTSPSGIAYDEAANKYYLSGGNHIDIADSDVHKIKRFKRKRYYHPQDIGGYNGVILSCIWQGGKKSYIDLYRESDCGYLGSISVPMGEIESVCVDDGKFVILLSGGSVYRTKKRVTMS